jgi:hypothetical protein
MESAQPQPLSTSECAPVNGKRVVYLPNADKYRGLTRRLSQEQKGLDERTRMASRQPFHSW